jgi:glutathionylspermidine synthase
VFENPSLWPTFGFPERFWDLAIKSFHLGDKTIYGRMDLAVTPEGIKCFEYNSDSSSCIIECCLIQGRWSHVRGPIPPKSMLISQF